MKQINFKDGKPNDADLALLADCQNLEYLSINASRVTERGWAHLAKLPRLRTIFIEETVCNDADFAALRELKSLDVLNMEGRNFTGKVLEHFGGNTELRYLVLSGAKVGDEVFDHVKSFAKLRSFSSKGESVTGKGAGALAGLQLTYLLLETPKLTDEALEVAVQFRDLETLMIGGGQITTEGVARIRNLPRLKFLRVSSGNAKAKIRIADEAFSGLGELPSLESLQIHNLTTFTGSGFGSLNGHPRVHYVSIQDCPQFGDVGIAQLAAAPRFHTFAIKGAKLTDKGLAPLARCQNITLLGFFNIPLTDACLTHLNGIRTLRGVNFGGTKVTPAGGFRLQQTLTRCDVDVAERRRTIER